MNQANQQYLEENKHYWLTLRDAFYLKGLSGDTRSNFQRIMAEEFQPGYTADLWCPACAAEMVKQLYQRYEQWQAAQPITVEASFPKHDKE